MATLQWARTQGIFTADRVIYYLHKSAAGVGHLAVMQWLWRLHAASEYKEHMGDIDEADDRRALRQQMSMAVDAAAAGGHLEVLRWLRVNTSDAEWADALPDREGTLRATWRRRPAGLRCCSGCGRPADPGTPTR